jgi:hypothetical protein
VIRAERMSGKSRDGRDELARIMDFLHAGDELVVVKLDRLGRSSRALPNTSIPLTIGTVQPWEAFMANEEHVARFKQRMRAGNAWRLKNPDVVPSLLGATASAALTTS